MKAMQTSGGDPLPQWAIGVGGPNGVDPGATSLAATVRLLPGAMSDHANIVNPVSAPLFQEYLLPVEVTSVVLLVAVVGAVVLAKRGDNVS